MFVVNLTCNKTLLSAVQRVSARARCWTGNDFSHQEGAGSLEIGSATKRNHYYYRKPSDDDTFEVNSDFPQIGDRRRRCGVHAPPAARVYLPYLHMLLFTPEGEMSRLHLNTEITAMPDSDKPRPPRPPS